MLLIETGLVLFVFVLTFLKPDLGGRTFGRIERPLAQFAKRRTLAVITVGLSALALRAAVLPILPVPYPALQDEFSYQLMADTFAHGRLANPTHPMWMHFESFGVIHRPTYCSMYYPAQGLFMALGQMLAKHTFWGVWLSAGLMCASLCWALQAWVSPIWAFVGGMLAVIRIGVFSYWANSYWGGAVAAIGGALVLGAFPRLKRSHPVRNSMAMGLGFALLANSRPYEGLFFSVPVLVLLAIWIIKSRKQAFRSVFLTTVVPLGLLIGAVAIWMMFYFSRTTRNPFLSPYVVDMRTYFVEPVFPWLPLRPVPHYNHEILRRSYLGFGVQQYAIVRMHPILSLVVKMLMLWFFFLGPLLTLFFLVLALAVSPGASIKDIGPKLGPLLWTSGTTLFAISLPVYINPHYAAPATAAFYALMALSMQRIRRWRLRNSQQGLFVLRAIPTLAFALLALRIAIPVLHLPISNPAIPQTWASSWFQLLPRSEVERYLKSIPGQHLAIVHYSQIHDPRQGWVSNAADIDNSRIVWAHDMGQSNKELISYFGKRDVWDVFPDENPVRVLCSRAQR
jgi:hypothetical protein